MAIQPAYTKGSIQVADILKLLVLDPKYRKGSIRIADILKLLGVDPAMMAPLEPAPAQPREDLMNHPAWR